MAQTWVPDIEPGSDFSLANIPFGIITTSDGKTPRVAVAIGPWALDMEAISLHDNFPDVFPSLKGPESLCFARRSLNQFAGLGRKVHREVREGIQNLLSVSTTWPSYLKDNETLREAALIHRRGVKMLLPMEIGDYTDFYAGYHHAFAVGSMFRGPQNALQPNYTHLPVGYHGRASSIVVSGTGIRRPWGQIVLDESTQPLTAPSRKLDLEVELGCFLCKSTTQGESISVAEAEKHIFGYVLLNDWSARDIQAWEYVPLGPFNGKNFATTISPWVVLADALEPFKVKPIENKTPPQEYLKEKRDETVFDINLEAWLTGPEGSSTKISQLSSRHLMWSFPQMIAHHSLGGCPMRVGDLLGSGTISGTGNAERGSMLEMSENGRKEILLYGMDMRKFLKDGDTVSIRGHCGKPLEGVGFGECAGRVYSAEQRKLGIPPLANS